MKARPGFREYPPPGAVFRLPLTGCRTSEPLVGDGIQPRVERTRGTRGWNGFRIFLAFLRRAVTITRNGSTQLLIPVPNPSEEPYAPRRSPSSSCSGCSPTPLPRGISPAFAGKPLSHWVGRLKDDNPLLREEALAVLGEMGASARDALPTLMPMLKSPDKRLRLRAAVAVWKIERQSKDVLPVLFSTFVRDDDHERRRVALQVLEQMGAAAAPAAPALVALLNDDDPQARAQAANVLRQMRSDAIPALTVGLTGEARGRTLPMCAALAHVFRRPTRSCPTPSPKG